MPLTPGTRLGSYEIAASPGAGGMGEVYRAKDLRLGRDVALQPLPADRAHAHRKRDLSVLQSHFWTGHGQTGV